MANVGSSRRIPHSISAPTPKGLERRFLLNNLAKGMEYSYFDISWDGKNWVAWFYKEVEINVGQMIRTNPNAKAGG